MLNLWSTTYGLGVQSSTLYFRTDSRFSWHRGGTHNDSENNSGGGTVAMTLDGSSNLTVTGTGTFNSDLRLKKNIFTIENALEKTLRLRGVEYDRIDNGDHQIGLIAQEVEEVIPQVVYTPEDNSEGMKSVAYQNVVSLLIEAIKEQQKQIEDLKSAVEDLKSQLDE